MKIILAPARTPRAKRSQQADAVTSARSRHQRSRAGLIVALSAASSLLVSSFIAAPGNPRQAQLEPSTAASPASSLLNDPVEETFDAEERPGEPVIETIDGSIPDPRDAALLAQLAIVEREQATQRAELAALNSTGPPSPVPDNAARAGIGGLNVVYLTEPPADVRAVVDAAAAEWDAVLATRPSGPVEIEFDWRILPPNVLGLAAPTSFHRNPRLPTSAFYPIALANTILETDLDLNRSEITITLASNLADSSTGWFIEPGPTTAVPARQVDLFTVVVHEIGHGLGFTGSGRNGLLNADPVIYDLLARYDDQPVVGSGRVTEALTSGDLFIEIGGGRTAELFAPSSFINQVSFSHFDESPDPTTPGGLMTPAFGDGELNRTIDAATLGVMAQLGWPVDATPTQPRITDVAGSDGTVTVSLSNGLGRVGLPPESHTVVVRTLDGSQPVESSVTVPWNADTATVIGVPNGAPIQIEVTANAASGRSASAITTASDRPSTVVVTGIGTSRTIGWRAPGEARAQDPLYIIDRRSIGGAWSEIGRSTNTLLTDDGLAPGTYQYRVRAESNGEVSDPAISTVIGVSTSAIRPMELDGQVGRLYFAFFGREPDAAGMAFWLGRRARGESIEAIANQFATSPEFQALVGEPDDGLFVDAVYDSVLGRPADADGRAFWINQLATGTSRGELMIRFSETPEFVVRTNTVPASTTSGAIARFYWAFLQRPPEAGGVAFWSGELAAGTSLTSIADGFAGSTEFVTTYGSLSDDEFIDVVYDNVLGRRADDAGFEFWRAQLASGTSRGAVMFAFSNSPEFILTTGTLP